jgi:hypothetical protein
MKRVIALVLLSAISCGASPKHWWKDKRWWVGVGIIGGAVAADVYSTCQRIGVHGVEAGIAFAGNRSCGTTMAVGSGAFGFETALHAVEWHFGHDDPNRVIRSLTPWIVPAAVAPIHIHAAIHNLDLPH